MAAGGTAPIITSRAIPPEFPAAKDNTRTPNRSSLFLTAAVAPLSANTKVPPRSKATSRELITICSLTTIRGLYAQPGLRRHHERFHPCFQGRMDHRRETRVVIGGNFPDGALALRFRVHAGIGSADEPEDRRRAPLRSKRSEILAGTCGLGL